MKKLVALICASPALLFASGANAQNTNYSLNLSAGVPAFCSITNASTTTTGPTPSTASATVTGANFAWTTNFTDGAGHIPTLGGNVILTISANNNCTYTLNATNGAMVGSSGNNQSIPYQAAFTAAGGTPTAPSAYSPVTGGAGAQIGTPITVSNTFNFVQGLNLGFRTNSPANTQYPRDTYSEIMVLTITPS